MCAFLDKGRFQPLLETRNQRTLSFAKFSFLLTLVATFSGAATIRVGKFERVADRVESGTWNRTRSVINGVRINARPGTVKIEKITTKAVLVRDIMKCDVHLTTVRRWWSTNEFGGIAS